MTNPREIAVGLVDVWLSHGKTSTQLENAIAEAIESYGRQEWLRALDEAAKKASGMRGGEFTKAIVRAIRALAKYGEKP